MGDLNIITVIMIGKIEMVLPIIHIRNRFIGTWEEIKQEINHVYYKLSLRYDSVSPPPHSFTKGGFDHNNLPL